jgi:hypothetical protein
VSATELFIRYQGVVPGRARVSNSGGVTAA